MKVFCCVLLLVAGLAFSSSTPTKEECDKVLHVVSLSDRTKLYGKRNLIMGFNSNDLERAVLMNTRSGIINLSEADHGGILLTQDLNVNGSCVHIVINTTVDGDRAEGNVLNVLTNQYQLYETCEGSIVTALNSTHTDPQNFLKKLSVSKEFSGEEKLVTQSLYLFSTEKSLDEAKLDHFKKQAACLGFPDEPSFVYDGKTEMCPLPESH